MIGSNVSGAGTGGAEVYRSRRPSPAPRHELNLYVAATLDGARTSCSACTRDSGGQPTALLGSGRLANPADGRLEQGHRQHPRRRGRQAYWLGLLNPADGTGTLRWHDRAGGSGGAEQT